MACESFLSELECTVCFEIPRIDTKVYQCKNGHLFCVICYSKLQKCSMCQDDFKYYSSKIRNQSVENMIRQLPSLEIGNIDSLEQEIERMKSSFRSFEIQVKDFNRKLSMINSKINDIKSASLEKSYFLDGFGFVEAYVTSTDSNYAVYWGPNREDINFSGTSNSVGTSVEGPCHAITQAGVLGISKLCVIMNSSIPVYTEDKLQELDGCLKRHQSIAVKFRGASGNNNKIKAAYAMALSCGP